MAEEKSAIEQFLEGGDNSIIEPVDNQFTEQPEEFEEKPEKQLPFNQDPKIQKYLDKREKEIEERLSRQLQSLHPAKTETEDEFKEAIDSLTVAIGNDTPEKLSAINAFKSALVNLDRRALLRAEEKIEELREREYEAEAEAEEELDEAFDSIEATYDVDLTSARSQKLRSDFLTYVERIAPKGRDGEIIDYPDMHSAWETFSEMRRANQTPSRAKELAARSMARSSETVPQNPKKIDWNTVDEFMDTLK